MRYEGITQKGGAFGEFRFVRVRVVKGVGERAEEAFDACAAREEAVAVFVAGATKVV